MIIQMRLKENDGLLKLINHLPNDICMAEIGCYTGESTSLFLKSNKIKEYYAIDPWAEGYDDNDIASKSPMAEVEKLFDERTSKVIRGTKTKLYKMKMDFIKAFHSLPELNVVYIDGDHTYEGVLIDILLAKKKVKSGGIIAGHDYRGNNHPIGKALINSIGLPEKVFPDSSWMITNVK